MNSGMIYMEICSVKDYREFNEYGGGGGGVLIKYRPHPDYASLVDPLQTSLERVIFEVEVSPSK